VSSCWSTATLLSARARASPVLACFRRGILYPLEPPIQARRETFRDPCVWSSVTDGFGFVAQRVRVLSQFFCGTRHLYVVDGFERLCVIYCGFMLCFDHSIVPSFLVFFFFFVDGAFYFFLLFFLFLFFFGYSFFVFSLLFYALLLHAALDWSHFGLLAAARPSL